MIKVRKKQKNGDCAGDIASFRNLKEEDLQFIKVI